MPVIVNGAAVLTNAMLPLVIFAALKLDTVLAPASVCPPTEFVVNKAPLIKPAPLSLMAPLEVNDTLPAAAAKLPVMFNAPVLLIETLPPPD